MFSFYSQKHLCWLICVEYLKCMQIFPCPLLQHFMTDIIFLPVPTLCMFLSHLGISISNDFLHTVDNLYYFSMGKFKHNAFVSLCECQKPHLTKSQRKMPCWQLYSNFLYLSPRAFLVSTNIIIHCFLNLQSLFNAQRIGQCVYDIHCTLTHKSRPVKNCHSSINFAGFLVLWPWRPYHK
jgi:hypothetical protein